jgi:hypothetical protein
MRNEINLYFFQSKDSERKMKNRENTKNFDLGSNLSHHYLTTCNLNNLTIADAALLVIRRVELRGEYKCTQL